MSLGTFALRLLPWLPACFAAWWLLAPAQSAASGWIARAVLRMFERGLVEAIERSGSTLAFVTTIQARVRGSDGVLVPEVDAMVFGYGLPVFVALMLASRAAGARIALGAAALFLLQGLGVALACLAQLVQAGAGPASAAGLAPWGSEAVAVAYQLASLVVPGAAPILLWAALQRATVGQLIAAPAAAAPRAHTPRGPGDSSRMPPPPAPPDRGS